MLLHQEVDDRSSIQLKKMIGGSNRAATEMFLNVSENIVMMGSIVCPLVKRVEDKGSPLMKQMMRDPKNFLNADVLKQQQSRMDCGKGQNEVTLCTDVLCEVNAVRRPRRRPTLNVLLLQQIHSKEMKNKEPSWKMEKLKTKPLFSWDENFSRGGGYGAGAPDRGMKIWKTSGLEGCKFGSKGLDYDVLKPIMAMGWNELKCIGKCPDKDHRTKNVINAQYNASYA